MAEVHALVRRFPHLAPAARDQTAVAIRRVVIEGEGRTKRRVSRDTSHYARSITHDVFSSPRAIVGVFGSNVGVGNAALSTYTPGAVFTNNAIAGPWPTSGGATTSMYSNYPGNFFPASLDAVGFLDRAHDNYKLSSGSPFKGKATDGTDLGVDFDALDAALS